MERENLYIEGRIKCADNLIFLRQSAFVTPEKISVIAALAGPVPADYGAGTDGHTQKPIYLTSYQSSVRNGEAGKFALLYKLQTGLFAHAYRTATGLETEGLLTITLLPDIIARAG